jgi:hypothetical protein
VITRPFGREAADYNLLHRGLHSSCTRTPKCDYVNSPHLLATVRLRYRPGITSADRVIHGAVTYNITAVIDIRSARRELHLMCRAVE